MDEGGRGRKLSVAERERARPLGSKSEEKGDLYVGSNRAERMGGK